MHPKSDQQNEKHVRKIVRKIVEQMFWRMFSGFWMRFYRNVCHGSLADFDGFWVDPWHFFDDSEKWGYFCVTFRADRFPQISFFKAPTWGRFWPIFVVGMFSVFSHVFYFLFVCFLVCVYVCFFGCLVVCLLVACLLDGLVWLVLFCFGCLVVFVFVGLVSWPDVLVFVGLHHGTSTTRHDGLR